MRCVKGLAPFLVLIAFAFAGPTLFGAAEPSGVLPRLLAEVEQNYTKATTLQAEFVQVNESAAIKKKTTTSGILRVKRPDKVRWETTKPQAEMSLLVSDGRKYWYYTPPFDDGENGQVIERKSSQVHSRLAQALLSGSFSMTKDMIIVESGPFHFTLTPKKGTAGSVKRSEIFIDQKTKLITRVVLEHAGGNRSEIKLSKLELGLELGDDYFRFVAPPNTDRVKE